MTDAINTSGETRRDFFYREMNPGEDITYTLIFVVDSDRIDKQILQFGSDTAPLDYSKTVDGISFQIMPGEFLGIMGSSGSGKSTLLNCIATVIKPSGGRILLQGTDVSRLKGKELSDYRGDKIGYLFQNFELLDNLTGRENIMLPLSLHKFSEKDSNERLEQLASYFEINEVLNKFPSQMSGGQKQRIAAARALILNPEIILADEPTGALDSKNAKLLMNKLSGLNELEHSTIFMVTHDSNAASYCNRILFVYE